MANEDKRFVPVYATGKRLCFDWACTALDDADIPYFSREYNAGACVRPCRRSRPGDRVSVG